MAQTRYVRVGPIPVRARVILGRAQMAAEPYVDVPPPPPGDFGAPGYVHVPGSRMTDPGLVAQLPAGTPGHVRYQDVYTSGMSIQQVFNAAAARAASAGSLIVLTMPPGEFTFSDFSQANTYGLRIPVNLGIKGSGSGPNGTVFKMVKGSSTKGPSVPVSTSIGGSGGTNQFSVMGIQNTGGSANIDPPIGLPLWDFSVICTWQPRTSGATEASDPIGHLYNGLRLQNTRSASLKNVYIEGCPGDQAAPPGETFGLNIYKGSSCQVENVEIDGRRTRQGKTQLYGAAPIGGNSHNNAVVKTSYFHHNPYSMPTMYLSENWVWNDCDSYMNRNGWNHERVGKATHNNPYTAPLDSDTGYPLPTGDPAKPGNYNFSFMNDGIIGPANGTLYINNPVYGATRNSRVGSSHEGDLVVYQGSRGTTDTQTSLPVVTGYNGAAWPSTKLYVAG